MAITLEHDREADAIYMTLRDLPYAYGEDVDHERRIDYAEDRLPIGIELLDVSHGVNLDALPEQAAIGRLLEEHSIRVFMSTPAAFHRRIGSYRRPRPADRVARACQGATCGELSALADDTTCMDVRLISEAPRA